MPVTQFKNFKPASGWEVLETIEMHTCGEPLRVFVSGLPELKGDTILEMRRHFKDNHDNLRRASMFEPRGHADMYGAVITPPVSEGATFGTFFMHNEGYSTMCGHAVIALGKLAAESGLVDITGGKANVVIDAPPGRIECVATMRGEKTESVSFRNVPSFLLFSDRFVDVPGIGKIRVDVAYGGAFYAFVKAQDAGVVLDGTDIHKLIDYGRRIKKAVAAEYPITHPYEDDLGFLYGTIFTGDPYEKDHWSRNVCIFADGEVDRSPTGSGVSARAALHYAKGELAPGEKVTIESILGTTMDLEIVEVKEWGGYTAVIPEVTGTSSFTGSNRLWIDPDDELAEGFLLR
jgi:trans-L-3-hydroxyproline dehydratase